MEKKKSFGASLVLGFIRLRALLPLSWHYKWARLFAWFAQKILHYQEEVAKLNISRSLPEKRYDELNMIQDRFYRHFGEIFAEMIWFGGCRGERGCRRLREQRLMEITNMAEINAFYDRCPSVMLLNSHAGNWELMGGFLNYSLSEPPHWGIDSVVVLYKRLHSALADQVIGENRCAPVKHLGYKNYIESDEILRYAVSHRREKRLYVFNTDQFPYWKASAVRIPSFISQPTWVMTGGAHLASKMGMGVAYIRWRQDGRGHYKLAFVPLVENASEYTPEQIMEIYYQHLEEDIRQQPWLYLWTHKRWR